MTREGNPQVVLEDTFESGTLTDTDRWIVDSAGGTDLQITNGFVQTDGAGSSQAWHSNKIPKSTEQEIRAFVAGIAGDASYVMILGRLDSTLDAAGFTPIGGYGLKYEWSSSAVRTIRLIRFPRNGSATGDILKSVNVTPLLDETSGTDDAVRQEIRLTITEEANGVRLRAFVNEEDDENPTLTYLDQGGGNADLNELTIKEPGLWGFEINDVAGGTTFLESISAIDKYIVPVKDSNIGRTLAQLRADLKVEVSRGGQTSLDDTFYDRALTYAQQEVMRRLGRLAIFNFRREKITMTASADDPLLIELPTFIEYVEHMEIHPKGLSLQFAMIGPNSTNTAWIIRMSENVSGQDVWVTYYKKITELLNDDDRCSVPRMHDEVLIMCAAKKISRRSADRTWHSGLIQEYDFQLKSVRTYLTRLKSQQKMRIRTVPHSLFPHNRDARYVDSISTLYHW